MAADRQRSRSRSRHRSQRTDSRSLSPRRRRPRSRSPPRSFTTSAPPHLPAAAHREELLAAMRQHAVVLCVGETGSGKTTQLPQYILSALDQRKLGAVTGDKIVVTQPRRVATVSVAQRVASELGSPLPPSSSSSSSSSVVGYTVRFDDRSSSSTRLKFVTDGVLVRECLEDPLLRRYAIVVLDEAHERSLHTDILFGLLKQALAQRDDLRVLITSATLDTHKFVKFFTSSASSPPPVVTILGRAFPVEIFHSKQTQIMGLKGPLSPYVRSAVETTLQIHRSEPPDGHILVFLTGQHEIEDACAQLRQLSAEDTVPLVVLPLYGALSARQQHTIFDPCSSASARKAIVATNLAETSLTIDGVRYVVDAGFNKHKAYNPSTHLESLVVVPISQTSAQQRAGRAGRTAPGKCYRLYSKDSYAAMAKESVPEIQRTNLANAVLYLKVLGVHNVLHFQCLDPPEEDALLDALHQLLLLDAIDARGTVTAKGRVMAQFPLEPKLARFLVEAVAMTCEADAAAAVAMLCVENVYDESKTGPSTEERMLQLAKEDVLDPRGDHPTYIRLLLAFNKLSHSQQQRWCDARGLRLRAMTTASAIHHQLLDLLRSLPREDRRAIENGADPDYLKRSTSTRLRYALCAGFFTHAATRCGTAQAALYRALGGGNEGGGVHLLHLHPLSTLPFTKPPVCLVYHELVATTRPFLRHAVAVEKAWVQHFARGKALSPTLAELRALSGVESLAEAQPSTTPPSATHQEKGRPAAVNTAMEHEHEKAATIAAAQARFLKRKRDQ